ncbi:sigma-54 interaction domain-containing protein [Peptoanaerobacter stomatis]|uniref:sigma-54 interaction domain-containing protein n=1 Tax=Peptoanaerobacter stomatis TaxID=796937 RepID=UPI003FA178C2
MDSPLKRIQNSVIEYANAIANVIGVDVEIVDSQLNTIAGTGAYRENINKNVAKEGYIYIDVIKTGQLHVIKDPGKNILCSKCSEKDECRELMQISMPIKYEKEIVGVIQLVCTKLEQKQKLIAKEKDYLKFIKEIAGNITDKLHELDEQEKTKKRIELFHQIVDDIDKMVIVLNAENTVIHINKMAKNTLNIEVGEKINVKKTHEMLVGEYLFTIQTDQKDVDVIGRIKSANSVYYEHTDIIICTKTKNIKDRAYNVVTGHNYISTDDIIGSNKQIKLLKERIKKIAKSTSTVFITGESGTGKELIARSIHSESDRADKPFIAVNCAAIPDSLLETELFGYVKGAFTGASDQGRIGKFELANRGVIFLDEIGDMPLHLQAKILRLLQDKELIRIGSNKTIKLDVRVVTATNKDLKKLIEEKKFREDLYYRINVIPISVPPLRKRLDDIEKLAYHMLDRYNKSFGKNVTHIDNEVIQIFMEYDWEGNIRELENVIEYMMNISETDTLTEELIPINILEKRIGYEPKDDEKANKSQRVVPIKELEMNEIRKALNIYGYDTKGKKIAAKKLGIGIATLYRKIEEEINV